MNGVSVDQFADGRAGIALAASGTTNRMRSRSSTAGVIRASTRPERHERGVEVLFDLNRTKRLGLMARGTQAERLLDLDDRWILFELQGRPGQARDRGPVVVGRRRRGPAARLLTSNGLVTSGTFTHVNSDVRNVCRPVTPSCTPSAGTIATTLRRLARDARPQLEQNQARRTGVRNVRGHRLQFYGPFGLTDFASGNTGTVITII